jgi:hypothetical protein
MAEKNLIIGAFTGYTYNQLKPWVESVEEVTKGENVDKVMVVGQASEETKKTLIDKGWILQDMPQINIPVHVLRFLSIYDYLQVNWKNYRYVVTTDVKDVYFQSNPFKWLEQRFLGNTNKLVAGSESMLYMDEPWGSENLWQTYGPYVYEIFSKNKIYNVGTIGGTSEYVKDLVFNIFTNATNRPIPIVDQAVYNVLLNTQPYKDITLFADQADGWACQAGTTVDPSKIEQFRPALTEEEPTFENGLVLTGQDGKNCKKGTPFVIVHQYDRVPEWKQYVMQKYNQEDPNSFFVYRT